MPYTIDLVLPGGRPLVSTYDQFAVELRDERVALPQRFWDILPVGVPVQWRVRLVPDRARGQTELDAPASEFRTLTRLPR